MQRIAGLDLAASEKRVTGLAILDRDKRTFIRVTSVHTDGQILGAVLHEKVSVVVIDAPLSFPRPGNAFREVELEAMRRGARLLPLTMPSMRLLILRARKLVEELRSRGIEVYETHPSSALRLSRCSLGELLQRLGVVLGEAQLNRHERDAVIAAIVGLCIFDGCADRIEAGGEVMFLLKRVC